MIILDIIVGYYLPSNFGWFFFVFVLITESLLVSKFITRKGLDKRVLITVIIANIITTLIGYYLQNENDIGNKLINWIPIEVYHGDINFESVKNVFISTFIWSFIIEAVINLILLFKLYKFYKIIIMTFLVNVLTYSIGYYIVYWYAINNF